MWQQLNTLQQEVCNMAVVGTTPARMQLEAFKGIVRILESVDVLRVNGDCEMAIRDGILRAFCPHGLGHSLGVCTHDVGDREMNRWGSPAPALEGFPTYRAGRELEPGYVLTVEPGIYFIPSLLGKMRESEKENFFNWKLIDELIPFGGMRIEDNVVVRNGAPRNITREFLP
jgi:Xaa-Pro dipeptidase